MRPEHLVRNHLVSLRLGQTLNFSIPSSPTYGDPTKPITYEEPLPANGDRKPSLKSPFNYRGALVGENDNRILTFESSVEKNALLILQARRDVVELRSQWPTVKWTMPSGEAHRHTFDFFARKADGTRVVIAAKPILKLLETNLMGTLLSISRSGLGGLADSVSFLTERYATDDAAYNASEILLSRRLRNDAEYEIALTLLKNIRGPVHFRELLAGAAVPALRRTALWCLVDEQRLRPVSPGRIDDTSLMTATL